MMPKNEVKQAWTHHNEVNLNTLTQGYQSDGASIATAVSAVGRVGNAINCLGIHYRGVINNNSGSESVVRLIVVGHNGNQPVTSGLFRAAASNTVQGISSTNGLDAMYYPINKTDFHVYWDKLFKLGGVTGNSGASSVRTFSKYIKLNRKKIEFHNAGTGTAGQSWYYTLLAISADANDDTTTGTVVEFSALERFYYVDP